MIENLARVLELPRNEVVFCISSSQLRAEREDLFVVFSPLGSKEEILGVVVSLSTIPVFAVQQCRQF